MDGSSFIKRKTAIFCTFKAKGVLVFAVLDGTVLTGFSFAAMAAAMAGQPLALVGLAQGTIHPAGRHKLLQSHFLFSINHMFFRYKKPVNHSVDRLSGVSFQKRYFEKIVRLQRQRSGAAVMATAAT